MRIFVQYCLFRDDLKGQNTVSTYLFQEQENLILSLKNS